jgi:hypothetical protein
MKILLLQLDGKIPNIALMRLAHHHRELGDQVKLIQVGNERSLEKSLYDPSWDRVYGSLIFARTKDLALKAKDIYPDIILGGTGWDLSTTLEQYGVTTNEQDYSDYPNWKQSIGFSQRGCRLTCSFCVVPKKEGKVSTQQTINEIWRGDPYPREIILLDNDFFGQPEWRARIKEMQDGKFKVSFNQGINARMLNEETAAAISSVNYRDDSMKVKRIYTAWDNLKDEKRLFAGLEALVKNGVRPRNIMVYMLIGYWPGETMADIDYRRAQLRKFGALPYPMPYVRTRELVGFQRWVIGSYDKRGVPWSFWEKAGYQPRNLVRGEWDAPAVVTPPSNPFPILDGKAA